MTRLHRREHAGLLALVLTAALLAPGCRDRAKSEPAPDQEAKSNGAKPKQLYVPDPTVDPGVVDLNSPDAHVAESVTFGPGASAVGAAPSGGRCPHDMVDVAGAFCIDRFEVSLVDAKTSRELSPHYPPSKHHTNLVFDVWATKATTSRRALGREIPVPQPPPFQLTEDFAPRALSVRARIPAGYLSRGLAEAACKNAGKRLCSRDEWVRACRGDQNTQFPYGNTYRERVCNVHRKSHPATLLHGDASRNHLDPRLGLTYDEDGPLLMSTGESTECFSRWGQDAIYDMVGNLDEWIEEPGGEFLGGFFSRATREGCSASIDVHDPGYLDYSLGARCCKN